jgi:hypothetical protein
MSTEATAGHATGGQVAARRGDLIVIHLRHRDFLQDGRPGEYDRFQVGQVTSVTRAGQARLYRPAGRPADERDATGRPFKGLALPAAGLRRALILSAGRIDVQGAMATAACHAWPGHEAQVRDYGSLDEVQAALRPHLLDQPGWERLRDAARTWEGRRAAAGTPLRPYDAYIEAVSAANEAYRQQYEQATAQEGTR